MPLLNSYGRTRSEGDAYTKTISAVTDALATPVAEGTPGILVTGKRGLPDQGMLAW
jgi:hypothetical protein